MDRIEINKQLCTHAHDVYAAKNKDYGDSFAKVRDKFPNAILIRLNDKLSRLETLYATGEDSRKVDESIEDTLLDMANYCLMEITERQFEQRTAAPRVAQPLPRAQVQVPRSYDAGGQNIAHVVDHTTMWAAGNPPMTAILDPSGCK